MLAQVIWGLGYTFTSGATQAWISDEVGEEKANQLFMRATRVGLVASLLGMGFAMFIGANNVALPIQFGAVGVLLMGVVLIFIMPETGFHPTPKEDRNNWQHMWHTFNEGVKAVRVRPRLMTVLGVGFFYGLYSEGFDRLWVKHLLDNFEIPVIFGNNQLAFFAVLRIAAAVLTIFGCPLCGEESGFRQLTGDWTNHAARDGIDHHCDDRLCVVSASFLNPGPVSNHRHFAQRTRPAQRGLGESKARSANESHGPLDDRAGGCGWANGWRAECGVGGEISFGGGGHYHVCAAARAGCFS